MQERLQKIIARAGIASRRHAEALIRSGQVRVNGAIVTELGAKADPDHDRIEAAGKLARVNDQRVYLLLNKPTEVVSTLADPEGRRTLRHLLVGLPERVFPVGRLDYATSGAIFLTNDGELAGRMMKAAPRLPQTYWIKVKGQLSEANLRKLGSALPGELLPLRAARAAGKKSANRWYEVEMNGARIDVLRRTLLQMSHPVEKMKRIKLALLEADTVAEGEYRRLEPEEVAKLSRAVDRILDNKSPNDRAPNHRALNDRGPNERVPHARAAHARARYEKAPAGRAPNRRAPYKRATGETRTSDRRPKQFRPGHTKRPGSKGKR